MRLSHFLAPKPQGQAALALPRARILCAMPQLTNNIAVDRGDGNMADIRYAIKSHARTTMVVMFSQLVFALCLAVASSSGITSPTIAPVNLPLCNIKPSSGIFSPSSSPTTDLDFSSDNHSKSTKKSKKKTKKHRRVKSTTSDDSSLQRNGDKTKPTGSKDSRVSHRQMIKNDGNDSISKSKKKIKKHKNKEMPSTRSGPTSTISKSVGHDRQVKNMKKKRSTGGIRERTTPSPPSDRSRSRTSSHDLHKDNLQRSNHHGKRKRRRKIVSPSITEDNRDIDSGFDGATTSNKRGKKHSSSEDAGYDNNIPKRKTKKHGKKHKTRQQKRSSGERNIDSDDIDKKRTKGTEGITGNESGESKIDNGGLASPSQTPRSKKKQGKKRKRKTKDDQSAIPNVDGNIDDRETQIAERDESLETQDNVEVKQELVAGVDNDDGDSIHQHEKEEEQKVLDVESQEKAGSEQTRGDSMTNADDDLAPLEGDKVVAQKGSLGDFDATTIEVVVHGADDQMSKGEVVDDEDPPQPYAESATSPSLADSAQSTVDENSTTSTSALKEEGRSTSNGDVENDRSETESTMPDDEKLEPSYSNEVNMTIAKGSDEASDSESDKESIADQESVESSELSTPVISGTKLDDESGGNDSEDEGSGETIDVTASEGTETVDEKSSLETDDVLSQQRDTVRTKHQSINIENVDKKNDDLPEAADVDAAESKLNNGTDDELSSKESASSATHKDEEAPAKIDPAKDSEADDDGDEDEDVLSFIGNILQEDVRGWVNQSSSDNGNVGTEQINQTVAVPDKNDDDKRLPSNSLTKDNGDRIEEETTKISNTRATDVVLPTLPTDSDSGEEDDTSDEDDNGTRGGLPENSVRDSGTDAISRVDINGRSSTMERGGGDGAVDNDQSTDSVTSEANETIDALESVGTQKSDNDEACEVADTTRGAPLEASESPVAFVVDRKSLESSEDDPSDIKVSVVTWNLAEESPSEEDAAFFRKFRKAKSELVLISGQECENIKPRRTEGRRSRELRRLMIKMLGKQYVPVALHLLGGIQFGLFVRKSFLKEIEYVGIADVTCGIGNVFHNK